LSFYFLFFSFLQAKTQTLKMTVADMAKQGLIITFNSTATESEKIVGELS
jgi:hypothetical protein